MRWVSSLPWLFSAHSLRPRHHSKTTGFGLVSCFVLFFFPPSKDTLYPTPKTNMVGMRLEWSSLTNYNICYLKNIFIYSSGDYEANKIEHKDAFVTIKSGCSNSRNMGKDRERGLLWMQQVRPWLCHRVQQSGHLGYSAPPDTTWQMSHCHFRFIKQKTVFLLRSCPIHFRHVFITASACMSKTQLCSSRFGMANITDSTSRVSVRSSPLLGGRERCKTGSLSFSSQMTAFRCNGQRESMTCDFKCPLSKKMN